MIKGTTHAASTGTLLKHSTRSRTVTSPFASSCGAWSIISSPNTGVADILNGVVAISSSDAWAVGSEEPTSGVPYQTLTEHWDGSTWSIISTPIIGTYGNTLYGVTALSTNDVWAVGNYDDVSSSTSQALVEHWDGTAWSMVSSGVSNGSLNSITSVPSTNQLWAVGIHTQASGSRQTLTEHWDGTSWGPVPSPSPRSQGPRSLDDLLGVAAIGPNSVWALGYTYHTPTLVERWDGTRWFVASIPLAGSTEIFFGVAKVPNSKQLWTVGAYSTSSTSYQTLIEVRC